MVLISGIRNVVPGADTGVGKSYFSDVEDCQLMEDLKYVKRRLEKMNEYEELEFDYYGIFT